MAWSQAWGTPASHAGVLVILQGRDAQQHESSARLLLEFVDGQTRPLQNQLYRHVLDTGWVPWS